MAISDWRPLDNDNDNDNDTLREVPHWSDEGLASQARVSGPWPHKKESVLQVKLALLARCKTEKFYDSISSFLVMSEMVQAGFDPVCLEISVATTPHSEDPEERKAPLPASQSFLLCTGHERVWCDARNCLATLLEKVDNMSHVSIKDSVGDVAQRVDHERAVGPTHA